MTRLDSFGVRQQRITIKIHCLDIVNYPQGNSFKRLPHKIILLLPALTKRFRLKKVHFSGFFFGRSGNLPLTIYLCYISVYNVCKFLNKIYIQACVMLLEWSVKLYALQQLQRDNISRMLHVIQKSLNRRFST